MNVKQPHLDSSLKRMPKDNPGDRHELHFQSVEIGRHTPKGIPGTRLLPVLLILLALLCGSVAYFISSVHRMEQARSATAQEWRHLALLLDRDYDSIEQQFAQKTIDEQRSVGGIDDFAVTAEDFRTTVDPKKQREKADLTEIRLLEIRERAATFATSPLELQKQVHVYNEALAAERSVLNSPGGRLVRIFLVVPELSDFTLAR